MTRTPAPPPQAPLNPQGLTTNPGHPHQAAHGTVRTPTAPLPCNGCTARWTGVARAHCTGCHKTFGSVGLFDRHRSVHGEHGTCHHPATITSTTGERVMFLRDGMWRSPEMSEEQKTRAFGNRT